MSDNLKKQINDDIKTAMKGGDKKSLAALRLISAAIKQHEVDNREDVDDAVATNLLTKLAKQRRESITQYEKADRNDLVEQEVFELDLISNYLPEAASDEDISQAIQAAIENGMFLGKWLAVAYLIEALMIRYVPASWVAQVLGGEGAGTIVLASLVGAPAYLNGYAAVPLLSGLIEQGMSQGAAMASPAMNNDNAKRDANRNMSNLKRWGARRSAAVSDRRPQGRRRHANTCRLRELSGLLRVLPDR